MADDAIEDVENEAELSSSPWKPQRHCQCWSYSSMPPMFAWMILPRSPILTEQLQNPGALGSLCKGEKAAYTRRKKATAHMRFIISANFCLSGKASGMIQAEKLKYDWTRLLHMQPAGGRA